MARRPASCSTTTSSPATCACCGSCGRRASPTLSWQRAGARRRPAGATWITSVFEAWSEELEIELPLRPRALATLVANLFQGIEIEPAGVDEVDAPHREVLDAVGALIARAEA